MKLDVEDAQNPVKSVQAGVGGLGGCVGMVVALPRAALLGSPNPSHPEPFRPGTPNNLL